MDRRRSLLARPHGIHVENEIEALRITCRWFHPMALLVIAGFGPLLFWLFDEDDRGSQSILVGAFRVGLALVCLYALALTLLNRTVIEVTHDRVTFRHGPLPGLLPRREVAAADVTQLHCRRHGWGRKRAQDYDYELEASLKNGRTVSLLEDIPSKEQARFLAQEIERRLRLTNRRVEPGEPE